jgi:two-component system chemotaxis response regulator CheY
MSSILVVDDESAVGRLLSRLLGKTRTVRAVTSALEALTQLRAGVRFDVILCDVNMPEMNGPTFLREVARLSREQARRIVFLTGGYEPSLPNRSLAKPFDLEELIAVVDAFLPIRLAREAASDLAPGPEIAPAEGPRRSPDEAHGAGQGLP